MKPDVSAPGYQITSADNGTSSGYTTFSGTSMATPFVAGVALLMLEANPALTPQDVKTKIMQTAEDWGRGPNNAPATTGADPEYGAGKLDAYAAIKSAGAPLGSAAARPGAHVPRGDAVGHGRADRLPDHACATRASRSPRR